jgi:hypothetical protein
MSNDSIWRLRHIVMAEVWPEPWPLTKAGTLRRNVYPHLAPYTPLYDCERCAVRSVPRRVQYRPELSLTLCMSCWNKLAPLQRALDEVHALRKLCRKIEREAKIHVR